MTLNEAKRMYDIYCDQLLYAIDDGMTDICQLDFLEWCVVNDIEVD